MFAPDIAVHEKSVATMVINPLSQTVPSRYMCIRRQNQNTCTVVMYVQLSVLFLIQLFTSNNLLLCNFIIILLK